MIAHYSVFLKKLALEIGFFKKNNFICLFLAVLGLHCQVGFSLVVPSVGYSLVVVCQLLIALFSLVTEHRL